MNVNETFYYDKFNSLSRGLLFESESERRKVKNYMHIEYDKYILCQPPQAENYCLSVMKSFIVRSLEKLTLVREVFKSSSLNFSATSSLLPYLTIHMQSIGITVEEIAIIY